jgi:amino acid permease
MNFKQSIIGSSIAFLIATSCCWLPALIIGLGGASSLLAFANGLEQFSGIFMLLGIVLFLYGGFQFYKKNVMKKSTQVELQSTITCPNCGFQKKETMPTNACQFFYECKSCSTLLKPKEGDCCVYCSYGTVACPPIQLNQNCC